MSATEVVTPEVVSAPADARTTTDEVEQRAAAVPAVPAPESAAGRALEAATQHVLDNPGVPGHNEFLALATQARMLHLSGAAPRAVREDPFIAFHVAMVGRDLGLSPSAALNLVDVIHTSNGPQLSLSPQLRLAQVKKRGLGDIRPKERTTERCLAGVYGPDGTEIGEVEFTWEDARMAGLVGPQCMPGAHKGNCGQRGSSGGKCNQGYRTYPKRMLWWRCVGYGCDDYFPEASLGLYSPEELGAAVDEDGRAIDVASVELPPGYDAPGTGAGGHGSAPADEPPHDADALWQLQESIQALPPEQAAALKAAWTDQENSRLYGYAAYRLPAGKYRVAKGMVNAQWAAAVAAGADRDACIAALRLRLAVAVHRAIWLCVTGLSGEPTADSGPAQPPSGPQAIPAAQPGTEQPEPAPEPASDEPGPPSDEPSTEAKATELAERSERKARDMRLGREWSTIVQALAKAVPQDVCDRIAADVQALHHSKVNAELAEQQLDGDLPPDVHIDVRRMAVVAARLEAFIDSGVVKGGDAT